MFTQPWKILALVLCLALTTPAGSGAEKSNAVSAGNAPAANAPSPDTPQTLSAAELEELSQRAEEPGPDVAGGALSNEHLTYIVIALATAVIVLIAVN
jgi:hypothetical protein